MFQNLTDKQKRTLIIVVGVYLLLLFDVFGLRSRIASRFPAIDGLFPGKQVEPFRGDITPATDFAPTFNSPEPAETVREVVEYIQLDTCENCGGSLLCPHCNPPTIGETSGAPAELDDEEDLQLSDTGEGPPLSGTANTLESWPGPFISYAEMNDLARQVDDDYVVMVTTANCPPCVRLKGRIAAARLPVPVAICNDPAAAQVVMGGRPFSYPQLVRVRVRGGVAQLKTLWDGRQALREFVR